MASGRRAASLGAVGAVLRLMPGVIAFLPNLATWLQMLSLHRPGDLDDSATGNVP